MRFLEVKCCKNEKGLQSHRKKSAAQLKGHIAMLKKMTNISLSGEEAEKIKLVSVWPNLSCKEICHNNQCPHGSHDRFKDRPKECLPPGSSQAPKFDPKIEHWFAEHLVNTEAILRGIIDENVDKLTRETWMNILQVHTTLCCGALYSELNKNFFLLANVSQDISSAIEASRSAPLSLPLLKYKNWP